MQTTYKYTCQHRHTHRHIMQPTLNVEFFYSSFASAFPMLFVQIVCSPFLSYLSRCFDRSFSFFSHLSFYSEFGLYASLLLVFFFMFIKNGSNSVRVKNCLMEEFHIKITSKLKSHSRRGERNVQMNKNESSQHTNTHDSN